jgi:hypothetical protein
VAAVLEDGPELVVAEPNLVDKLDEESIGEHDDTEDDQEGSDGPCAPGSKGIG